MLAVKTSDAETTVAPDGGKQGEHDTAFNEQIDHERGQILLQNLSTSMAVSAAVLSVVCALLIGDIKTPLLAGWYALILFISGIRWWYCSSRFRQKASLDENGIKFIFIVSFGASVGWGCLPFMLSAESDAIALQIIVFMIAGMTAGSALSYASHLSVVTASSAPALALLALFYLIEGGMEQYAMGGVLAIFFFAMRSLAARVNQTLIRAMTNEARAEQQQKSLKNQNTAFQALAENYKSVLERAQESDVAQSTLVANTRREIRTPVHEALQHLDALDATDHTLEQRDHIEGVRRSLKDLLCTRVEGARAADAVGRAGESAIDLIQAGLKK